MVPFSVEHAGPERDDSADEDERNGRCEQTTGPDADRSHHFGWTRPQVDLQYLLRCLVKKFFTPKGTAHP